MSRLRCVKLTLVGMIATAAFGLQAAESLVEVRLIADLDDERGYCLDIAGGQGEQAPVERGLQAHTCYDYTGEILVDQAFVEGDFAQGQFNIQYFDVCMSASTLDEGASLMLDACDSSDSQGFDFQQNGQIVLNANPSLCVTASATEKKEGRGGSPAHVMRPVTLEVCADDNADYQKWTTFSF
ncbi:ricin-type beta-trefoil lectin domain protein [Vibrio ulleungensis]|uniref:Ricin-type beta-trefoil lectin domain protein n=1 Tax=Vibrio ulleungensis TaxID=2807619 RepID=A0ABS2HB91_9VIBR|nr:ricin-type beta-trefoil lectin domain protein [Vibrio ulleungensis]MBM7034870.1 ricin-type beta-trefoil lectin domain protein [Vibrio ulleungensis]